MAGGGDGAGEQNEKEGKRGKEKEEKERGKVIFLVIYCTLLLIIWGKNKKGENNSPFFIFKMIFPILNL